MSLVLMAMVMLMLMVIIRRGGKELMGEARTSLSTPPSCLCVSASAAGDSCRVQFQLGTSSRSVAGIFADLVSTLHFTIRQLAEAALNSIVNIAIVATVFSTTVGTLRAYGLWKRDAKWLSGSLVPIVSHSGSR